nr:hypothetical protein [uncultured Enterocloster sp.]
MEKWNCYSLRHLSVGAREKLPEVLAHMGYDGRFKIVEDGCSLVIRSNFTVVSKAFQQAENLAHKERGYLIQIRQASYSSIWIPETEAGNLKEAYRVALQAVDNGWPVENDPETEVGCSIEGENFHEEWEL